MLLPDAGATAGPGVAAESRRGDGRLAEPLVGHSRPLSPGVTVDRTSLGGLRRR